MKREENEAMRLTILDSVIACKKQAAGADVSLAQISSRAGISERTLNRYFPDKEMLYYDAAVRFLRMRYDAFAQQYLAADKAGLNALARLLLLLEMQISQNSRDMPAAKTFVRAFTTALRTAVYRELPVPGYDASVRDIVLKLIEEGVAEGSMRPDAVPMDTYLLVSSNYIGLVERLIYRYSVQYEEAEHKAELLRVCGHYVQMLRGYLSADGHGNRDPQ